MKNVLRIFSIIVIISVIGFSFTACDSDDKDDSTNNGRLTINGLNSYNGWKIYMIYNEDFVATDNNKNEDLIPINGNSVTFHIWTKNWKNYNGNDQNVVFVVDISDMAPGNDRRFAAGTVTVNFTNGVGSGTFVLNP